MPPVATSDKLLKRNRRKANNTSFVQGQLQDRIPETDPRQTRSEFNLPEKGMEAPSTPPKFTNRTSLDLTSQDEARSSASGMGKRRHTPRKKQGMAHSGSSPVPKVSAIPRPNNQINSSTPGKNISTPSRAYAGPTFHASPAASSLPIPKLYSKSVPEVDKGPGMTSVAKGTSDKVPDENERLPTQDFAHLGEQEGQQESPLDIFFKADREQKARQRLRQDMSFDGSASPSPAPGNDRPRHHSRHSTNGSMGALFPMELESREPAQPSHEKALSDPITNSDAINEPRPSASVAVTETPEELAERKAKTAALKKLLLSSIPSQADSKPSSRSNPATAGAQNDSPTRSQAARATSPQLHKQLAAQTIRQASPSQRPLSNLRKEMSASMLPETEKIPELPASPTPSRTRNAHKPASNSGRGQSPDALETAENPSPFKNMEDDLRRILKMDSLPSSTSATDVPS
ncbi:MAG: hypothetical protein Q9222_002317 [Ikaeria aurantiellina]